MLIFHWTNLVYVSRTLMFRSKMMSNDLGIMSQLKLRPSVWSNGIFQNTPKAINLVKHDDNDSTNYGRDVMGIRTK